MHFSPQTTDHFVARSQLGKNNITDEMDLKSMLKITGTHFNPRDAAIYYKSLLDSYTEQGVFLLSIVRQISSYLGIFIQKTGMR